MSGFAGLSIWPADVELLKKDGFSLADIRHLVVDSGLVLTDLECICAWLPQQVDPGKTGLPAELARSMLTMTAERLCPIAEAVGATSITLIELFRAGVDVDVLAEGMARVCDIAAAHGLAVALEFVPTGDVPDLQTCEAVVRRSGRANARILFDSWHFDRSGSTLDTLAAIPGELIGGIQISDAPVEHETDLSYAMSNSRLFPGEGTLDLSGLMQTLGTIGCTAPVSVEVMSQALRLMPPATAIRKAADTGRQFLDYTKAPG